MTKASVVAKRGGTSIDEEVVSQRQALIHLVWHLESCTMCLMCIYNGWGEPLCANGEKLYTAANVPRKPEKLPEGMGGCFKAGKILRGEGGRRPRVRTKIVAGGKVAKSKKSTKPKRVH